MSKNYNSYEQDHEFEQKPKQKKANHNAKYMVCLDTNIVISLAGLHNQNQTEISTLKANGFYESVRQLKSAIEKRQIVAVITPIVLQELVKGMNSWANTTIQYLQKSNILVLDMPENKLEKYFLDVENIATSYSKKLNRYTIIDLAHASGRKPGEYPTRIFACKKDKETGLPIIQNDARIMAEASSLGLLLVTNNTVDFIHNHRPELIQKANRQLGLASRAIPVTSIQILQMYKKSLPFPKPKNSYGNLISADLINLPSQPTLEA